MIYSSVGIFFVLSLSPTFVPTAAVSPALILTSYIYQNRTDEAKNLSLVDPKLFLNVTSHSGYLTLEEKYNSNTFFWYFPVANKPVNETPWIIWLQGGPGASSLDGLFLEMGPFEFDGQLKPRNFSWCKEYSMVFLDNPVGAGFSFTDSEDGFVRDMDTYSEHLFVALQQLVMIFPELRSAPLYIAGESYAGRYVPAFGSKVLENEKKIGNFINLEGLIMGNPVLNREDIANFTALYYHWGLLDSQGVLAAKPLQDQYFKSLREGNVNDTFEVYSNLLQKLEDISLQSQMYNVLVDNYEMHAFETYLSREDVREALHVGDIKFTFSNASVHTHLIGDFLGEVQTKMETLLDHYKVLIYCGQLDLTAPCVAGAEARRQKWHWSRRDDFMRAPRQPWWFNESVAGYVKSGGEFTEALVRGAGHLVPIDKPAQTQQLVSYFIRGLDMPVPPNYTPNLNDTLNDITTSKIYVTPKSNEKPSNSEAVQSRTEPPVSTGMIVSVTFNVILALIIVSVLFFYIRKRRRSNVFYTSVDNISDEIFLS